MEKEDIKIESDEEDIDNENTDINNNSESDKDNDSNEESETENDEENDENNTDEEVEENIIEDVDDFKVVDYRETLTKMYDKKQKITIPILTKYEKARIIGYRAKQLELGAIPFVDTKGLVNTIDIVKKELYSKKLPFIIRRPLPDGSYEDWPIQDLVVT
jgi:DNA-directed RNA polymerases I, II, and III subunit RPABC2